MQNQNDYRRFIDESTDSNNKESVNSVCGRSEGFDIFDKIIAEKESKKATVDVTNSLQKDSATEITDDQNPFRCGMSRVEAVDNGKNPSNYYPPRGFVLGESRATMEIIPVNGGAVFGSSPTPTQHATFQNVTESVSESRTGESEVSVQTQQPASPTQIPPQSINPFATNSSDPSFVTQPVLPVRQQNNPTGAVNTGSDVDSSIYLDELLSEEDSEGVLDAYVNDDPEYEDHLEDESESAESRKSDEYDKLFAECGLEDETINDDSDEESNVMDDSNAYANKSNLSRHNVPQDPPQGNVAVFGSSPTSTAPTTSQNVTESVSESRTEESEVSAQTKQPAPPVSINQNQQKSTNPFVVHEEVTPPETNSPRPVQPQHNMVTDDVNVGSSGEVNSVSEEQQKKVTTPENAAVQKNPKNKNPLIEIVNNMNLYCDQYNRGWTTISRENDTNDTNDTDDVAIESMEFEQYLTLKAAKQDVLITCRKGVVHYASALAKEYGVVHPVHLRFNFDGDELVYDLNDGMGRIIIADKDGFRVEQKGRYKFRRTNTMRPMLEPDSEGDIKLLLKYINVSNKHDEVLILAWIVAALMTNIDRPFLLLYGPTGTGKSTAANILRGSIDPVSIEGIAMPRKVKDFNVSLSNNQIPSYDNLTYIADDFQDLLCRVVTGGGDESRQLYTDGESHSVSYKRTFILTAIPNPITHGDLMGRSLAVKLSPIEDSESKGGHKLRSQLMKEFEDEKALIFGGILKTFAAALGRYEKMKGVIKILPRMGEFFVFASAVAEVTGYGKDVFAEAYKRSMRTVHGAESINDSLTFVLIDFLENESLQNPDKNEFVFKMSELHTKLMERVKTIPEIDCSELPKAANSLSAKLKKINIRESYGWDMTISDNARDFRRVTFRKVKEIV